MNLVTNDRTVVKKLDLNPPRVYRFSPSVSLGPVTHDNSINPITAETRAFSMRTDGGAVCDKGQKPDADALGYAIQMHTNNLVVEALYKRAQECGFSHLDARFHADSANSVAEAKRLIMQVVGDNTEAPVYAVGRNEVRSNFNNLVTGVRSTSTGNQKPHPVVIHAEKLLNTTLFLLGADDFNGPWPLKVNFHHNGMESVNTTAGNDIIVRASITVLLEDDVKVGALHWGHRA